MFSTRTITLLLAIPGIILIAIAFFAGVIGLDFTNGFGILQAAELLLGMTLLTAAAFFYLYNLRPHDAPHSLQAGIGQRLALTGLIFAYISGFADLLRIGTHIEVGGFDRPFIGPLQMVGLLGGIVIILIGLYLYHSSRGNHRAASRFDFLRDQTPE